MANLMNSQEENLINKKEYLSYLFRKSQKSTLHLLNNSETTSKNFDDTDTNGGIDLNNALPQTISNDYLVTSSDSAHISSGGYLSSGDYLIVFIDRFLRIGVGYVQSYLSIYDTFNNSTLYTSDIWGYGKTDFVTPPNEDKQKYQDMGSLKFYVRIPQSERYQLYIHVRMEISFTDGNSTESSTLNITKLL